MNILDAIIGYISPEAGARREAWRRNLGEMRNYDAGDWGRLNAGWRGAYNASAEATDRYSRDVVRARARDLERNSDVATAVIGAYRRNVVGAGWRLQARTGREALDSQIEEAWERWCRPRNCDVTGQQSLMQMARMAVERKKVDGGILFKKCYTRGGFLPFKLQALEVDELDGVTVTPHKKTARVIGGIEYDQYNRPLGYWIKRYALDGFAEIDPEYVPAKDMIFLYSKRRPSQVREMSDLAPTIPRIRDLQEFMTAVSVKERIAACLSVFIKKTIPTVGIGMGRGSAQQDPRVSYEGKTITPGMIKELNAGDEIQVVNPSGQATDATQYAKLQQRLVGAGQGLSYEATSRDMSQSNYSSARQGIIEDELTYMEDRELILNVFLDEVYETFIVSGVLAGLFDIPDFWDNKDKYFVHDWVAAPKRWIDPYKEANAVKVALATGQKTFQEVCAEGGADWRDVVDSMADVLEYGRSKGIELGGILYGQTIQNLRPAEELADPGEESGGSDGDAVASGSGGEPAEGTAPATGDGGGSPGSEPEPVPGS